MTRDEFNELRQELWDICGEHLEMMAPEHWADFLIPVLMRMVVKERNAKNGLRQFLDSLASQPFTNEEIEAMSFRHKKEDWSSN